MADWFIDNIATGTGSGDSPANAQTSVTSFWAAASGAITWGDRVWLRRSNVNTWCDTTSTWLLGVSSFNVNSNAFIGVIGWPSSGQPFYAQRPASAVSAGWDSDVNTVFSNINMATLWDIGSGTWGVRDGLSLSNLMFRGLGLTWRSRVSSSPYVPKNNLHILNYIFDSIQLIGFRELTITASQALGAQSSNTWQIERLTLTSSCQFSGVFLSYAPAFDIKELVINTNSLQTLFGVSFAIDARPGTSRHIGRISGLRPKLEVQSDNSTSGQMYKIIVDDWYGEGPATFVGGRHRNTKVPVDGVAYVNSLRALQQNYVPPSPTVSQYNRQRMSGNTHEPHADGRAFVNYTASTPLIVRWPFYTKSNSSIQDAGSSNLLSYMHLVGVGISDAKIEAGSGFSWSGTSISVAGSAWTATGGFVPTVSGSGMLDFMHSLLNFGSLDLMFYGPPQVNSL